MLKEWYEKKRSWWTNLERDAIIIGFDRGMSQYLAAAVAMINRQEIGRYSVNANNIITMIKRERRRQSWASKKAKQGKEPLKKGKKGFNVKRLTRLGKSWLPNEIDMQVYRTNNALVQWGTELATNYNKLVIFKTEGLSSFQYRVKSDSKAKTIWGKAYNAAKDPEKRANALEQKRSYERSLFYASIFRTGKKVYQDFSDEANKHGHLVRMVTARYSSRRCPKCNYIDKRNRPTRDTFSCVECGFSDEADFVGATNNALRQ